MALFVIERRTALPPAAAWERLTAWERHSGTVPLTRITVETAPPTGVGTRFVARTGLGRLAFADPMRVAVWEPPAGGGGAGGAGRCRLEKTGRAVAGWAEIEVRAEGSGAYVVWREELRPRGVPRAGGAVVRYAGRRVFGRVVDALLAD
jgi:hypothetical protein